MNREEQLFQLNSMLDRVRAEIDIAIGVGGLADLSIEKLREIRAALEPVYL